MITVENHAFQKALGMLGRCVDRGSTIPILGSVKAVVNGRLDLSATDLDMALHVGLPLGGEAAPGAFLIDNFRRTAKACGAAGGETVTLEPGETGVAVKAGSLTMCSGEKLRVDDFPGDQTDVVDPWMTVTLSPDHLAKIARICPAISTEDTRYYLNGVYLHHLDGWTWRAVATDGHRMMFVDLSLPDMRGAADGVIIERKAIRLAIGLLAKGVDAVTMEIGGGVLPNRDDSTAPDRVGLPRISFTGVAQGLPVRLTAKVIDGTYPDYMRVMTAACASWRLLMPVARLRQAVQCVGALFSATPSISLTFAANRVVVEAFDAPGLTAAYPCEAHHDAPARFRIGFNGVYLMSLLNALRGPDMVMTGGESHDPVTLRDPADDNFTAIVMPMRVTQ